MALNVLVVDDSAVMRKMIIRSLQLSGLPIGRISEAGNGREGLEVLEQEWIDLALIDINMPVMNGEEMIEEIRGNEQTKDLPIIVVSTESSESRIEMLQKQGAGFVHKPFNPATLRETIMELTGVTHDDGKMPEEFDGGGSSDF
ncbi:MAG: response regulator [candidate division Zixibacteria bacterium]|nr:response regulator [candidate division Zixibacteria bacterium]